MKKRIIKIIFYIFIVSFVASIAIFLPMYLSDILKKNSFFTWPDTNIASLIPQPKSLNGYIENSDNTDFSAYIYNFSEDDFKEYQNKCKIKSHGFNLFQVRENNSYKAYDWEGYYLDLSYDSKKQMLKLHVLEPEEVRVLRGIEHYELEYRSYYNISDIGSLDCHNYDNVINKYIYPVRTSIGELYRDFPKEKSNNNTMSVVSIPPKIVNLEEEQEVWVYASYLDDHVCDDIRFTYDTLEISKDRLNIETHFEMIKRTPSSAVKYRIIVLSIIPINQSIK